MGTLVERRKDLRGKSKLESGLNWAKSMFGQTVEKKHMIFVIRMSRRRKKILSALTCHLSDTVI